MTLNKVRGFLVEFVFSYVARRWNLRTLKRRECKFNRFACAFINSLVHNYLGHCILVLERFWWKFCLRSETRNSLSKLDFRTMMTRKGTVYTEHRIIQLWRWVKGQYVSQKKCWTICHHYVLLLRQYLQ